MPIKVMYKITDLKGPELEKAIFESEEHFFKTEGERPRNIAKTIGYAIRKDLLFNPDGTIYDSEGSRPR